MKTLLSLFLFMAILFTGTAQEKKKLSKEETIAYIQTKLDEVESRWLEDGEGGKLFLHSAAIESIDSQVGITEFRRKRNYNIDELFECGDWFVVIFYDFEPKEIMNIRDYTEYVDPSVGYIEIQLATESSKCSVLTYVIETEETDEIPCQSPVLTKDNSGNCAKLYIPYLKSDPTNFNKIKKALAHLKQLAIDADDPFAD